MALHLVVNLVGQTQTAVVHGEQKALDLELGVELALDNLYRVEQLADAFQGKVFALNRNDDAVGCCQRVDCDESQRWRAVDKDEIILVADRGEQILDNPFAVLQIEHFYLCTDKVDVAGDDVESINIGGIDGITNICMVDNALVQRAVYLLDVYS